MSIDRIYQQCQWYAYPAFCEYLRTFSDHEQRIHALLEEKRQKYEMGLSEFWGYLSGDYAFGLKRTLVHEIFAIENHKRERQQKQEQAYYAHLLLKKQYKLLHLKLQRL